jgi:hypothetical protein
MVELVWDVAPLTCENCAKLYSHTCMIQDGEGAGDNKASKNNIYLLRT